MKLLLWILDPKPLDAMHFLLEPRRTSGLTNSRCLSVDEAASGRRMEDEGAEPSPFGRPIRRSNAGKTCSRKRLLHWTGKLSPDREALLLTASSGSTRKASVSFLQQLFETSVERFNRHVLKTWHQSFVLALIVNLQVLSRSLKLHVSISSFTIKSEALLCWVQLFSCLFICFFYVLAIDCHIVNILCVWCK